MNITRLITLFSIYILLFSKIHAAETLPLTLEEKVGQLLIVHFNGQEANEEATKLIREAHVGGFIYYPWANGLLNPYQVHQLSAGLQDIAKKQPSHIPLFITTDQEGGMVNRFKNGFTTFPANLAVGQTLPELAGAEAKAIGKELLAVGVNMNLAPVVDINSNSENPIIGIRSFGSDPKSVALYGKYALKGYKRSGVISVLKHFPGHGDTTADSHEKLPVIKHDKAHLLQVELYPFATLASKADVIMTAHLFVPELDAENPATFSKKIISGLLRNELKFNGLIMTDSLVMQGIMDCCPTIEEAAIRSLEAGHDLILLGGKQLAEHQKGFELTVEDILKIHKAIVDAVRSGRIPQEQIDRSVQRILKLKETYKLDVPQDFTKGAENVNAISHKKLAKKIANLSVKIATQQTFLPLDLSNQNVAVFAPERIREEMALTTISKLGKTNQQYYYQTFNPNESETQKALELANGADTLLICSYDSWRFKNQQALITALQALGKPVIIFVVANPLDAKLFKNVSLMLTTFSPVSASLQAAIDLMTRGKNE